MKLIRTNSENPDFLDLVRLLDEGLKITDGEDFSFYNQFNKLDLIKNVIIVYEYKKPVGCGAFKEHNKTTVEMKRMYVLPEERGKGIAGAILNRLEDWAREAGYHRAVLETGINQIEALGLYKKSGYEIISNYGQYEGLKTSVCFGKSLI